MGSCSVSFLLAALMVGVSIGLSESQLSYNYYKYSCPNVEAIVKQEVLSIFLTDATALAAFLRLIFHDCQVQVIFHTFQLYHFIDLGDIQSFSLINTHLYHYHIFYFKTVKNHLVSLVLSPSAFYFKSQKVFLTNLRCNFCNCLQTFCVCMF